MAKITLAGYPVPTARLHCIESYLRPDLKGLTHSNRMIASQSLSCHSYKVVYSFTVTLLTRHFPAPEIPDMNVGARSRLASIRLTTSRRVVD
jgi:hypothetical protein